MKSLFRLVSILAALSLGAFAYAGDAKKESDKKAEECKECTCGDACKNSKECCCKAKEAKKDAEKAPEKK